EEIPAMHKSAIYPEVIQRVAERRGKLHLYEAIDAPRAALVVIDMQNNWVMEGQPGYAPFIPAIVPNINRLAAAFRRAGGTVAWVQMNGSRAVTEKWQRFRDFFPDPALLARWSDALTPGNVGYELWNGLDVQPGDLIVEKKRFSAFIQGSSDLHERLERLGIDTVVITGTATNVCCESTARDANMLNYKTVMVSDGNAARSDAEHNATLSNLFGLFADVMTTDEVIAALRPAAKAQAAE
ncbi:MAG TPA: cysteine hydrolase, partial [Vicinamibacterales bacterium]|nr:cysteine hydrolase [Vicinamibacterales bacterium]